MKARTLPAWAAALLLLPVVLGSTPSSSYATPPATPGYTFSIREADAEGTTHYAPDYQPPLLGPEYTSNPPTYGPDDTYVQDEVIIRFRPDVPPTQQDALMQAHGMRFGRRIYGEKAFVAKVPNHSAMVVANALRNNPMLDVVGVNPLVKLSGTLDYTPNDPLAPQQEHLGTSTLQQINARRGWDFGHGLNKVSLIAIVDEEIDQTHPDIEAKYSPENWQRFYTGGEIGGRGHGTHVGGLAAASTDNSIGIAGTGFSAWPMSLSIFPETTNALGNTQLAAAVSAVNWASDHGASVINMSFGCAPSLSSECGTRNSVIRLLKEAIDRAYDRGITLVAAAGNYVYDVPFFPASFGQVYTTTFPPYDPKLVIAVSGTKSGRRHPNSNYGDWVDFGAPFGQDDGQGILSAVPITYSGTITGYDRMFGTSAAAPQVAGLASLLTSLGYTNSQVYDFIKNGATDLPCNPLVPCPGFDKHTGWGRINMGLSMELAHRTTPGMTVVPNKGFRTVQWFNFQGSGFEPSIQGNPREVQVCWTPPGGLLSCYPENQLVDGYGVAGFGLQVGSTAPYGTWTVSMCEVSGDHRCTSGSFTVLIDPN
ncbi:MAG TPA: S8 family serine peptidase [Chloroflexia bacterium]